MNAAVLALRELSVGYAGSRRRPGRQVVADMSVELPRGTFVALLGPNGAGKSTLIRTIAGLQRPLAGQIELSGVPLQRLSVEERARRAAVVLTERFDPGWFTVFEIVAFGRYPYTDARNSLATRDRELVHEALSSVGLSGFDQRRFAELSDGERQKALIARALAQESPLLVLDEPTAFLDAPARIEIFHLARRLAREGRSVILSTHEVDLALRNADRLWIVSREGRFEAGLPEELALSGAVGRAFDVPGLSFDPSLGGFRSTEERRPFVVGLSGEDPTSLAWTMRLIERLGLSLEQENGSYDALLRVVPERSGFRWELETKGAMRQLASLPEIEAALRDLVPIGPATATAEQSPPGTNPTR